MLFHPDFPFAPRRVPFFYGWVVAVAATVGIVMSIPGQTMGVSVFTDPLLDATGLSRLQMSNAYLVGTIISGLMLPAAGTWIDRIGVRAMVLLACAGLASTLVFLSAVDQVSRAIVQAWVSPGAESATSAGSASSADSVVWISFAILALAFTSLRFFGQGMLTMVSRTMLGKWFDRRRGIVSSVSSIFVNFGFASAPLVLSFWIGAAGWRGAWLEMGFVVAGGMGLVGWLLFRDNPEQCGLQMDGAAVAVTDSEVARVASDVRMSGRDYTRGEAIRTAGFWVVTLGIGTQSMVGTGITFHIVDMGALAGLSAAASVGIFLPISAVSVLVGLVAGWAVDRTRIAYLVMLMSVAQALTYGLLPWFGDPIWRAVVIAAWGFGSGFYGPLMAAALPRYFGRTQLGAISGVQMMVLVIGSAAGPSFLALFRQAHGDYQLGLQLCCAFPAAVFALALLTRDPPSLSR